MTTCLADIADKERLDDYLWCLDGNGYVFTVMCVGGADVPGGEEKLVSMHRWLMMETLLSAQPTKNISHPIGM